MLILSEKLKNIPLFITHAYTFIKGQRRGPHSILIPEPYTTKRKEQTTLYFILNVNDLLVKIRNSSSLDNKMKTSSNLLAFIYL